MDIRWAAGFFDGEGWVGLTQKPEGPRWHLAVTSTEESLLIEFARVLGCGRVYGPYDRGGPRKLYYQWRAQSKKDARHAAARLLRHTIGEKRPRLQEVLDAHEG